MLMRRPQCSCPPALMGNLRVALGEFTCPESLPPSCREMLNRLPTGVAGSKFNLSPMPKVDQSFVEV